MEELLRLALEKAKNPSQRADVQRAATKASSDVRRIRTQQEVRRVKQ